MSRRLAVSAPAKLNLHLEVLGRRPDGYHEVRTLLVSIDLADDLEAEEAEHDLLELEVRPAGAAPADGSNLVVRAAAALRELTGTRRGARLVLVKRIPAGGGLGGGSADAAAAIVLLERLWELDLEPGDRLRIASSLGADVPFFLVAGLALGVGRGDEVVPLPDLPARRAVVLVPPVVVPTAEVYRKLGPEPGWRLPDQRVRAFVAGQPAEPPWPAMRNDLEEVVTAGWPQVADALSRLAAAGGRERVAVTGSGAGVFALYVDAVEAQAAAETLTGGGRLHVGRTLGREAARLVVRELPPGPGGRPANGA